MGAFNKILTGLLVIAILAALGVLGYVVASPKVDERFTEFYILGRGGIAQNYPSQFIMSGEKIILVKYGPDGSQEREAFARIILGIVNREHETATYTVEVIIDGQPVEIYLDGDSLGELGPITLAHQEKWEHEVGFAAQKVGDGQRVDFVLYKDGVAYFEEPLHIWIDVRIQD